MNIVPTICPETFSVIAASLLTSFTEVSGVFYLNGSLFCMKDPKSELLVGSSMNAVPVGYVPFSMHTHPLIAYCTAFCNIGYPSGDDMRAWFVEALNNKGPPAIHICCAIEGTYILRVRPLNDAYNYSRLGQQIFSYFARYHNNRSTVDNSEIISPTEWVDICNKFKGSFVDDKLPDTTMFDCAFQPNVVEYSNNLYCGDLKGNCKMGKKTIHEFSKRYIDRNFYEMYNAEQVQTVCKQKSKCKTNNCDSKLQTVYQVGSKYETDLPKRNMTNMDMENFRYERDLYERMMNLLIPYSVKETYITLRQAYEILKLDEWLFSLSGLEKIKKDNKIIYVSSSNSPKVDILHEVHRQIERLCQQASRKRMFPNLVKYHTKDFVIAELPLHAWIMNKFGKYEYRRTNLLGLNRPENVGYGELVSKCKGWEGGAQRNCTSNCDHKTLFLSFHAKDAHSLIIHELTHSLLEDHVYYSDNHMHPFHEYETELDNFTKKCGIVFTLESENVKSPRNSVHRINYKIL